MRILMVHPHDITSISEPWTRRIKAIAQEFVKNGNKVKLAYFPLFCNYGTSSALDADYEAIPLSRGIDPFTFFKNTFSLLKLSIWADIVHFQKCHHYAALPAVLAAYLTGKPLHYDWDDWEEMIWYESNPDRNWNTSFIGHSFKVLERILPLLSDTVSVSSQRLRDLAVKFGVGENDIYPAPVGADLKEFSPDIKAGGIKEKYNIFGPLVLYIGQLHGAQYIDLFIRAAKEVSSKEPEAVFMIVGEGFMERNLKELASRLGISDKVIFTGALPHSDIPQYIVAADICVAAFKDTKVTRCKSPLKIVEYMACAKAIVASNVGEVRRMLGGAGVLVDPGNANSLAEGILRLIGDKDLRERLGKFARMRAEEKYNWSTTAVNLTEAYLKSCKRKD